MSIELRDRVANPGVTARKSVAVLVKGLLLKSSGEDRTAIELFIAGVKGREAGLRRVLATSADEK